MTHRGYAGRAQQGEWESQKSRDNRRSLSTDLTSNLLAAKRKTGKRSLIIIIIILANLGKSITVVGTLNRRSATLTGFRVLVDDRRGVLPQLSRASPGLFPGGTGLISEGQWEGGQTGRT